MSKVLNEYKTRYLEFEKSVKQSKKTLGTYEKQIGQMNRRISSLEDTQNTQLKKIYRELGLGAKPAEEQPVQQNQGGGGGKKKKKKNNSNNVDGATILEAARKVDLKQTIEDMKTGWEKEKADLQEEIALSQKECSEVQQKLAEIKKSKEAK